ncbi:MAG: hypothetical protein GF368_03040 [Candidatus Aenigmarchaeota archaeon]|nr:hypothetical protein [Candidatus Aenigmarchaeota archaeon]
MKEKRVKDIFSVSDVFSSPKRLLLLEFFRKGPSKWTDIDNFFNKKTNVSASVSEIYKHIHVLKDNNYIAKRGNSYIITKRGMRAIDLVKEIANTEPKVPKVEMEF